MAKFKTIVANFVFNKETKGAVQFAEVDDEGNKISANEGAHIGSIYIRKDSLNGGDAPKSLKVTVEAVK